MLSDPSPLACRHRRRAARRTEEHLSRLCLWGTWQVGALLVGRCLRCEAEVGDDAARLAS